MARRGRHHSRRQRPRRNRSRKNKITFGQMSFFTRKHPIATGIILIIAAFLVFRFSISNAQAGGGESVLWISLLALGLFIAGVLVLVGWWRNNISMMTTKHNVNWRNR